MTPNPPLLIKRLDKGVELPIRGTPLSAGWDIYCRESVDIPPGRRAVLPTGLSFAVEPGWYVRIAQAILERCSTGALIEITELPDSERGAGGLGSTGR